jgi:PAS domain S-box-containing protein
MVLYLLALVGLMLSTTLFAYLQESFANRTLRRSEREKALSDSTINSLPGVFYLFDQHGRFLRWNDNFAQVTGYTSKELAEMQPWDFFEGDDRQAIGEAVKRVFVAGENTAEADFVSKDGQRAPYFFTGKLVQLEGQPCLVGMGVDVTERRRGEQLLRQAKVMAEAANRSKSEFLANMSHEIRTPMTAILGFADVLLERDSIAEAAPEWVEAAKTIRKNGEYLLSIINDILDLSKIEAGKMTVEKVTCSPCGIVAEVKSLMRVRADAKGLSLDFEFVTAVPETVQTDPTRLRQILINVIANAIKFTEVGSVRLLVTFVSDGDAPYLKFEVVDTGVGMTQQEVSRLFQAFMQADSSTTRKFGGTGLGLTISKRLAGMLGGDVTLAATQTGVGTRFSTTVATMVAGPELAAKSTAGATAGLYRRQATLQAGCRILLAEDGPDNQRLIAHILKKAGAEVAVVENGRLAADAALAARDGGMPFDVVLMDMQMPEMDGYEATRLLRAQGYEQPIIALTAHAMTGDRAKCHQAGCDDYATKPINRGELIATIQRKLRSKAVGPSR